MLGPLLKGKGPRDHVFISERGAPITRNGFAKMLARLDVPPDLAALDIHPHMLRHSAGYATVKADLQVAAAFLGHKRVENTLRYRHLDPERFVGLIE